MASGLSFSQNFQAMAPAASYLEPYKGWTENSRAAFRDFVRNKKLQMNTMERKNNSGNWGLVLIISSAAYMKDAALFKTEQY